jgi:metallo-beta-lactamase family protein
MKTTLSFHGAARTVTGSKYLIRRGTNRLLVDAGLFQGLKALRLLNWEDPPFHAHQLDRVLLTHTHIDHIGYLPRLVRHGFEGPILATRPTIELARLLLPDSARIQEDDAEYANRKGFSRHQPALPLYTVDNAKATLELFEPVEYGTWYPVGKGMHARYQGAGHILGSASIELRTETADGEKTVLFSGDIGRYDSPLHPDPEPRPACDLLVMESTYGNRDHDQTSIADQLSDAMEETFSRRGTVLIPAFAVGRSQQLALVLGRLMREGRIPDVPIHIDSPMAVDATRIYGRHLNDDFVDEELIEDGRQRLFPHSVELHRSVQDSKRLNASRGPRVIISASGMLAGGRVLHHLKHLLPSRRNLIVMAGYQAAGTRGRRLLEGEPTLRIHGVDVEAKADCIALHGLSGHGDRGELLRWMDSGERAPERVYLTHGEPESSVALAGQIRRQLGWATEIPHLGDKVEI